MRRATTLMLCAALLVTACAAEATASEPANEPPMLLELNAPLLSQPLAGRSARMSRPARKRTETSRRPHRQKNRPPLDAPDKQPAAAEAKTTDAGGQPASADQENKAKVDSSPAAEAAAKPATQPAEQPAALPELTDAMKSVRAAIRRTMASYSSQPLNTRDNTAARRDGRVPGVWLRRPGFSATDPADRKSTRSPVCARTTPVRAAACCGSPTGESWPRWATVCSGTRPNSWPCWPCRGYRSITHCASATELAR